MDQQIRVRFAPSPTGPFHIGGARSALFNWLLARKMGGTFVLRVEDTDLERSTRESEENIKEALRWLGMDWDEGIDVGGPHGPYRQTERLDIYREYTEKLLSEGKAYPCYCTEEETEIERQAMLEKGETPRYSGRCRNLSAEEKARFEAEGRKPSIRLKVAEGRQVVVEDMVRGDVTFESSGIGDFIIVKSDGIPVYNYAVVLDDALMKITHVIRAEEHLSNTPRQIVIYDALGMPAPKFGHISLILGTDRSKMSKRHGATSVEQYRKMGYLPEAMVNFLALLGWAPGGEQELFTSEELIREFSMERVAKSPAVFDVDKLNWISAHYLRQADPALVTELALPHLVEAGFVEECLSDEKKAWLVKAVGAVIDHVSYAAQVPEHVAVFFSDKVEPENDEAREILRDADVQAVMDAFREKMLALETVDEAAVQGVLKSITKELKLGGKKVYMPIRVALSGQVHGVDLLKLIVLLGRDKALGRIADSLKAV